MLILPCECCCRDGAFGDWTDGSRGGEVGATTPFSLFRLKIFIPFCASFEAAPATGLTDDPPGTDNNEGSLDLTASALTSVTIPRTKSFIMDSRSTRPSTVFQSLEISIPSSSSCCARWRPATALSQTSSNLVFHISNSLSLLARRCHISAPESRMNSRLP